MLDHQAAGETGSLLFEITVTVLIPALP